MNFDISCTRNLGVMPTRQSQAHFMQKTGSVSPSTESAVTPKTSASFGVALSVLVGVGCLATTSSIHAAPAQRTKALAALGCTDKLGSALKGRLGGADTRVLLVKQFPQGVPLILPGASKSAAPAGAVERGPDAPTPIAQSDLCLIKLLVGPGHPGPADAPSTSAGIGIEVLLPAPTRWNQRIRAYGNSGWAGSPQASMSSIASDDLHAAAAAKGFVVATSDHGHVASPINASFAMNPDGTINTTGWQDFSERSLHVMAEKTKLLTRLFYGQPHGYAYWDGFSTGGRQGLKLAQVFPKDFDGILVGAPGINWTRFHTAGLYAQVAMQQDLGRLIAADKLTAVTQAAIRACGGTQLGFLTDPMSCRYDPAKDQALLCKGEQSATPAQACLTTAEAKVINKAWYGQTIDGTAPDPAIDNGSADLLSNQRRLWYGWTRGTELTKTPVGGAPGLMLAADQTALETQTPEFGSEMFVNATGKGANRWRDRLGYAGLADAQARGVSLQTQFSHINTDNADLSGFAAAGGKLLMYHGLVDEYIPVQGSIDYYQRVSTRTGGIDATTKFYRFYLVPGFTHSGRSEGAPSVPVPQPASGRDEMFAALQNWVENKVAPSAITVTSRDSTVSMPLCVYPTKIVYRGSGSEKLAASYACR